MPKISVLMPVYNAEKYLKEAVDSILNQTFRDFEFIIINDGSSDKSEEIILSYDDDRIRYIKNETNLRVIKTLNKGIELCKGEYIARMDADDICLLDRFQKQVDYLDKNLDCVVVGSSVKCFGDYDNIINFTSDNYDFITNKTMVSHPSSMIRKSVLIDNNIRYSLDFPHAEDYRFWNELKDFGKIVSLDEVLLNYRKHEEAITSLHRDVGFESVVKTNIIEYEKLFERKLEEFEIRLIKKEYKNITAKEFWSFYSSIKKYIRKNYVLNEAILSWFRINVKNYYNFIGLIKCVRLWNIKLIVKTFLKDYKVIK